MSDVDAICEKLAEIVFYQHADWQQRDKLKKVLIQFYDHINNNAVTEDKKLSYKINNYNLKYFEKKSKC